MTKVLITGAGGMLGTSIQKVFEDSGKFEVIATGMSDSEIKLDITNKDSINEILDERKPDVVINCAAYTNVEQAEDEPDVANEINGYAVGRLAEATAVRKIKFIHISTDYVFGENDPVGYREDDTPKLQPNAYGVSKYLGEIEGKKNNENIYICRVSWTFGPNGKNYIDTMLRLADEREELTIVTDETGVPTYTVDVARNLMLIIENEDEYKPRIYHIVSEGNCSRFDESKTIFKIADKKIKLKKGELASFPRKAKVPNYSILINTKLPPIQNWQDAIKEYIDDKK